MVDDMDELKAGEEIRQRKQKLADEVIKAVREFEVATAVTVAGLRYTIIGGAETGTLTPPQHEPTVYIELNL
jgi:hypothetical protein